MKYQVLADFSEGTSELLEAKTYKKGDVFEPPASYHEDMSNWEGQGIRFAVEYVIIGDDNKPSSHVVKNPQTGESVIDEKGREKREVDKSWRWSVLPVAREGEKVAEPKKNPVKAKAMPA